MDFIRRWITSVQFLGPVMAIISLLILILVFGLKDSVLALRWTFILAIIPGILAVLTIVLFVKESVPKKSTGRLFLHT